MRFSYVALIVALASTLGLSSQAHAKPGSKVSCPAVVAFKEDGTYVTKQKLVCFKSVKAAEKEGYLLKGSEGTVSPFPFVFESNGPDSSKLFKLPVGIYTFSWQFSGGAISDTACIVRLYDASEGYIDNATDTRYDGESGEKKLAINANFRNAYLKYECSYDLPIKVTVTRAN